MPNEQINSGLFLALSCETLSSVQTVAITYPDTCDHTTNVASPHLTLRHQTILLPVLRGPKALSRETHSPNNSRPLRNNYSWALTEQCREMTDSLSITFSGLRSRDFCRVGKTKSLNSAWDMYRRSGEQLSCKGYKVLSTAADVACRTRAQIAL